jgi:cytochrome c biogenesis protein CcdA
MTGHASVGYAFALGLVAAVNPCGFPLLPAYLALFLNPDRPESTVMRVRRALLAGTAMTAGFLVVFLIAGLPIAAGAQLAAAASPFVMIAVGVVLALFGIAGILRISVRLPLPALGFRSGTGLLAMAGYGVAYAVASLSCALPLFVAGVAGNFGTGLGVGVASLVAYSFGMGLFVVFASLLAALVGAESVRVFGRLSRLVPAIGSTILFAVGTYLIVYWSAIAMAPRSTPPVARLADAIQTWVAGIIGGFPLLIGGFLAVVTAATFGAVALAARKREQSNGATDK